MALGFDTADSIETLGRWQDDNGIPFRFATGPAEIITAYDVLSRATKIGISSDGTVVFREGYSQADEATWRERLRDLASE